MGYWGYRGRMTLKKELTIIVLCIKDVFMMMIMGWRVKKKKVQNHMRTRKIHRVNGT